MKGLLSVNGKLIIVMPPPFEPTWEAIENLAVTFNTFESNNMTWEDLENGNFPKS